MTFEQPHHRAIEENFAAQHRGIEAAFAQEGVDSETRKNLGIATAGMEEQVLETIANIK